MLIIEGVGDEVVQFFGVLFLIFLAVLAWWSTNTVDLSPSRTLYIYNRVAQNDSSDDQNVLPETSEVLGTIDGDTDIYQEVEVQEGIRRIEKQSTLVGRIRINRTDGSSEASSSNTGSSTQPDEAGTDETESSERTMEKEPSGPVHNIRIRLKYLNDDQKLVEGRLQELLGDFKRRHFSVELAAQKLVRLIFNGQVLQRDDQTLAVCGLYDNCVVHCLVHQPATAPGGANGNHNSSPPEWNLGGVFFGSCSLLLTLAWFCRYHYPHLFTLTTTTALVGLTGMFAVSILGMYMQDPESRPSTE